MPGLEQGLRIVSSSYEVSSDILRVHHLASRSTPFRQADRVCLKQRMNASPNLYDKIYRFTSDVTLFWQSDDFLTK